MSARPKALQKDAYQRAVIDIAGHRRPDTEGLLTERCQEQGSKVRTMNNAINWFEIPCRDISAGASFYERALDITLKRESFRGVPHAIFPADEKGVAGALVQD